MRRVCKRKIQIDALVMCYEVDNLYCYEQLGRLEMGQIISIDKLALQRIEGRYYDNEYNIRLCDAEQNIMLGQLKFGIAGGNEQSNTHANGLRKVWIKIDNEVLYGQNLHYATYIERILGLKYHNITALDLCLDTPFKISSLVKSYIHNPNITTILNGKLITDRNKDYKEITYTHSGSLNNQNKYLTVCVKQKKAVTDKSKGITLTMYDKEAEIRNKSGKKYILDYYGRPKSLYRTEIHLNNENIRSYLERNRIENAPLFIYDEAVIDNMFFHFLNRLIRFHSKYKDVSWKHILGRS